MLIGKSKNYFLNILFNISCPIFLSRPPIVVGMPVLRARDCFMPVIPIARLSEKERPFISFIVNMVN